MAHRDAEYISVLMKPKIAIVRGKFLNRYEMQFFEPLVKRYDITAFGSLTPYHDRFAFPVVKLPSPMDLPNFPYKMAILNRLFTDAHYLWGLEERLKGFDLVHTAETYFHYTQQCLNAKKKGYVKKVIATVLENIPYNNEAIWGRRAFKRRARTELDHIIALTQKTKDALVIEGCEPSKITIIGHYVDTQRFKPIDNRRMRTFHKKIRILFVGRLEEYKGVFDVLEVAKILINDSELATYSLQFLFVGEGGEVRKMRGMEQKLGIGRFVEHRSVSYGQIPVVYQSADIFVAPSKTQFLRGKPTWEEQYNTTLLEAQASGLPIVATKSGGIPENVGDSAILVEPGDVKTLAYAIKQFIVNEKLRLIYTKKARKRAETVHDAKIGANKLARLYEQILH